MIIYGTVKDPNITITRNELAEKIWYKEAPNGSKTLKNVDTDLPNGRESLKDVDEDEEDFITNFGYSGGNTSIQRILKDWPNYFSINNERDAYDSRWWGIFGMNGLLDAGEGESFSVGVPNWEKKDKFQFITRHKELMTLDRRSFYIMVIALMKEVKGEISEDDQKTWISLAEFEARHKDILSLTYAEANEISLKEAKTYKFVDERLDDSETPEEYAARGWDWAYSLGSDSMSLSESESECSSLNDSELNEFRGKSY